jgi:hypothetical protein
MKQRAGVQWLQSFACYFLIRHHISISVLAEHACGWTQMRPCDAT